MKTTLIAFVSLVLFSTLFTGDTAAQPKKLMRMDRERIMDHDRIMDKLNLTDEQQEKIEALRLHHQKEMIDLKADLEKKEIDLEEIKNKDNFTRSEIIAAVENINKIKNEIALKAANHRMDIYEQLTDEQKEIWKEKKHHFGMEHKRMFLHKRFHQDEW